MRPAQTNEYEKKASRRILTKETQPERIADLKQRTYSDGHPLDDVQYLECKIILKGDRFTSVESFYEFAKIVKRAAKDANVDFSTKGFKGLQPQIREVLFLNTEDYKLYNKAFILRRRIPYEHGFSRATRRLFLSSASRTFRRPRTWT